MMGPRTSSFCNALSFRKIRKYRVRGPSHIGLPPGNPKEICALMMPLKAYTKGRPRISRHLHRDMHPDDATGSVYHGSPAHISRPRSVSARADAVSACIGKWRRSRSRYPRRELSFYAQRRRPSRVSAHGPFNICSVWHHLCAEASIRQRLCAQAPYQRMQFRTAFPSRFFAGAQNDREVELVNGVPCHPERTIVILNEVKDLKRRSGLCIRFLAAARNDREGVMYQILR